MLYANVFPKQIKPIDFGWKNKTTEAGIFVAEPTGEIQMPKLLDYFDFTIFNAEEYHPHRAFGTRNFKSPFTMATRFLGFERAVVEKPDLAPITDELYLWNKKLLQSYPFVKFFHIGDDFAGNLALFISPSDWRKWLMPEYLRLVNLARFFGQKIIFHSDGDIYEVLEDIVSLGIDYLDYQPIGKMQVFEAYASFCGVKLIINSLEEQSHKHEASMSMQKKTT
ncbi:MAG: hypothetical protein WC344_05230 [Bacilli bacterium]|jgi:hypothetical protein